MGTRLGNNAKPTSTQESTTVNNQQGHPLTLPAGGPWNVTHGGGWLAGLGDDVTARFCLWSGPGVLLAESGTFTAAGLPFALGNSISYEVSNGSGTFPAQVSGGATVYFGWHTTFGDGVQFGRYSSGAHIDDSLNPGPGTLSGSVDSGGDISAWLYYEAANSLPNAPTLNTPTDGSDVASQTPVLNFTPSDPDADNHTAYTYQVDDNSDFSSPVESIEVTAGAPYTNGVAINRTVVATLSRGTRYYWRVKTKDAVGYGPYSGSKSFDVGVLPTASVTTPANGHTARLWYNAGGNTTPKIQVHWSFSDTDGHSQTHSRVFIYADSAGSPGSQVYDSGWQANTETSFQTTYAATNGTFYHVSVQVRCSLTLESAESSKNRTRVRWARASYYFDVGSTPPNVSVANNQSVSGNQALVLEYTMTGSSSEPSTWYSSIGTPALNRFLWHRVTMWGWGSATPTSPSLLDLTWTYGSVALVLDIWQLASGAVVDTGVYWFGTQSLRHDCNGSAQRSFQVITVLPETDLVLQGRIKALGNPQARYRVLSSDGTVELATTPTVAAAQEFRDGRVTTPVFNTGSNTSLRVETFTNAAGGNTAWFDVPKLEEGTVATPWNPGFLGGTVIDSGGVIIDAIKGAVFRLRGSDAAGLSVTRLGQWGLEAQADQSSDEIWRGKVTGDSNQRLVLRADGNLNWGSGSGAADVVLSRGAADRLDLGTGDSFRIASDGQLQLGSDLVLDRPAASILRLATGDRQIYDPFAAMVERSATQSITNSTWTAINFSATDIFDPWAWHDTSTNNERIVVDRAGTYMCELYILMAANTGTLTTFGFGINAASSPARQFQVPSTNSGSYSVHCVYPIELAASDYVKGMVFQNAAGAVNAVACHASVWYIGEVM